MPTDEILEIENNEKRDLNIELNIKPGEMPELNIKESQQAWRYEE